MLAIAEDGRLWEDAWKSNVLLVSSSTLLFVMRIVAQLWRQEMRSRNAQDIANRGAALYDKLVGFVEDFESVGVQITRAEKFFESAKGKLTAGQGNVIRQAQMLKKLGIEPRKQLPENYVELEEDPFSPAVSLRRYASLNQAPWLEGLNPRQAEAVTHGRDPLLILAGAGSGKTRVITSRIAWLIAEKGLNPWSILAVTFTNKAALEMRERAAALVPEAQNSMIRTFHSFGAWLLRRHAAALNFSPNFSIYDEDDQVGLLGQILPGMPRRELKIWAGMISRAKDEGINTGKQSVRL